MTASVHRIKPRKSPAKLECFRCGAETDAACDCGVDYVPAAVRASAAIAANPEKSDRAIAADLGVAHTTVQRARKSTGTDVPVGERIGMDGKVRKMPKAKLVDDDMPSEEEADAEHQNTLYELVCRHLRDMTDETRQKTFAYIRRTYHD